MSDWRVDRHYGFGGAQIPLQAEAHRGVEGGLRAGFGTMLGELVEGGVLATMRRLAGQVPAIVLMGLLFMAFIVTLAKDRSDHSPIEVVMLETLPLPVEPEELPEPIVELAPEPPPPIPEPVAPEPKPVPKPKPVQLAERPKPPPPPVAKPRPKPAPAMPKIARVEPPKPRPVVRPDRAVRDRPRPIERPRVAIDELKPQPAAPVVPVQRLARAQVARPNTTRSAPRLDAPAAPVLDTPSAPAPERTFRLAAARPKPGERPKAMPGLAPAPRQPAAPMPARADRPTRGAAPPPAASRRPRAPAPALAAAAIPTAPAPAPAISRRKSRAMPRTSPSVARRPAAELARAPQLSAAAPPKLKTRAGRAAPSPAAAASGAVADRPGVDGVPLGDLAACVTDREEDRLKQAVVAAVKTQEQCVSRKGTYRFIETKNLNAFLMWIDRAPSRAVEDRCTELRYALECLQSGGQRAAR